MAAFPNNIDSARLLFDPSFYVSVFSGRADPVCQGQSSLPRMEETSKRRRFFSSPEEYFFDEEYYEEHLPEKKQRLSPEQVYLLEKSFEAKDKLEPEQKFQLARKLGLRPRQVAVWFQNRRARWKTKQLEWDYDRLKSSYDSLVSDYDSIIKENEKLKAEVFSLTEKLQGNGIAGPAMLVSDENNPNQHPVNGAGLAVSADLQSNVKVEDRVSTGSGGSAVVDEDGRPQLVSDDSYVRNDGYPIGGDSMVDGFQSDEDHDSDDGQCFFSNAFMVAEQGYHDDGETLNWWVWS